MDAKTIEQTAYFSSATSMIKIHRKRLAPLAGLTCLVFGFAYILIFPTNFRLEMIIKISMISLSFLVIPSVKLGHLRQPILILSALAILISAGFNLESKIAALSAIAAVLLLYILNIRLGALLFGAVLIALWLLQSKIRSRGLEVTIILFLGQMLLFRFWSKPLLFYAFPVIYVIALSVIGFFFIYAEGIATATASNLARSSIVYTIVTGLPQNPLGYSSEQDFYNYIRPTALHLYSKTYNDPHNFFLSAAVWGGGPLFLISIWTYTIAVRDAFRSGDASAPKTFAISALAVFIATSTLSFDNVLFFEFLILCATQIENKGKGAHENMRPII